MPIIRVALDVPVNILFEYLAPDITAQDIGGRVCVPFGRRLVTGIIMEVVTHSSVPSPKIRLAVCVLREIPPIPKELIDLFCFCSTYYHHPLGEVAMNGLPGRLRSIKPFILDYSIPFQYRLTTEGHAIDISSISARSMVKRRLLSKLRESAVIISVR